MTKLSVVCVTDEPRHFDVTRTAIYNAPALATAGVGLAMGPAGIDVAIEAADIVIMGGRLTHLPDVFDQPCAPSGS